MLLTSNLRMTQSSLVLQTGVRLESLNLSWMNIAMHQDKALTGINQVSSSSIHNQGYKDPFLGF